MSRPGRKNPDESHPKSLSLRPYRKSRATFSGQALSGGPPHAPGYWCPLWHPLVSCHPVGVCINKIEAVLVLRRDRRRVFFSVRELDIDLSRLRQLVFADQWRGNFRSRRTRGARLWRSRRRTFCLWSSWCRIVLRRSGCDGQADSFVRPEDEVFWSARGLPLPDDLTIRIGQLALQLREA